MEELTADNNKKNFENLKTGNQRISGLVKQS